jgi:excisionase family DNA binding protein
MQKMEERMTSLERVAIVEELLRNRATVEVIDSILTPLLTTDDVIKLLKVNRRTISRLIKRGTIPRPLKVGGSNRWKPEEIIAALDRLQPRVGRKIEPETNN